MQQAYTLPPPPPPFPCPGPDWLGGISLWAAAHLPNLPTPAMTYGGTCRFAQVCPNLQVSMTAPYSGWVCPEGCSPGFPFGGGGRGATRGGAGRLKCCPCITLLCRSDVLTPADPWCCSLVLRGGIHTHTQRVCIYMYTHTNWDIHLCAHLDKRLYVN